MQEHVVVLGVFAIQPSPCASHMRHCAQLHKTHTHTHTHSRTHTRSGAHIVHMVCLGSAVVKGNLSCLTDQCVCSSPGIVCPGIACRLCLDWMQK